MKPHDLLNLAIRPALSLLPARMTSTAAEAMLLAIAMQESGLRHRVQQDGDADPYDDAVGWWQFERIGSAEVRRHPASAEIMAGVLVVLGYGPDHPHEAIAHNDVLAAAYARLALWRLPQALPDGRMDWATGWGQYLRIWRPGIPHEAPWRGRYIEAWEAVA